MAYCLAKPGLALIQCQPWPALLQRLATWLTLLQSSTQHKNKKINTKNKKRLAQKKTTVISNRQWPKKFPQFPQSLTVYSRILVYFNKGHSLCSNCAPIDVTQDWRQVRIVNCDGADQIHSMRQWHVFTVHWHPWTLNVHLFTEVWPLFLREFRNKTFSLVHWWEHRNTLTSIIRTSLLSLHSNCLHMVDDTVVYVA